MASQLLFSDNLRCAFLAEIVASFERNQANRYLGRTALQKLTYFSKAVGVPIPCSFEIYTYGPYSEQVTFAADAMLADDVLEDASSKPEYSNYRLGTAADVLTERFREKTEQYRRSIDLVVLNLGAFDPSKLELISTLHFIHSRFKAVHDRPPNRSEVVKNFKNVKGDKFSEKEISRWHQALCKARLI